MSPKMDEKTIRAIEAAIEKGYRVELVSTVSGIKVYTVKRKELNKDT